MPSLHWSLRTATALLRTLPWSVALDTEVAQDNTSSAADRAATLVVESSLGLMVGQVCRSLAGPRVRPLSAPHSTQSQWCRPACRLPSAEALEPACSPP